jgi:hypothetical protein
LIMLIRDDWLALNVHCDVGVCRGVEGELVCSVFWEDGIWLDAVDLAIRCCDLSRGDDASGLPSNVHGNNNTQTLVIRVYQSLPSCWTSGAGFRCHLDAL